jgi:hypothetical protein
MRCVECAREKEPLERGWVTVLSPSAALRIHYCPDCMAVLVRRAEAVDDEQPDDDAGRGEDAGRGDDE